MIKFTWLSEPDAPAAPCVFCKQPTQQWAAYSPPGATIKKPVCLGCGEKIWNLWELVKMLRGLKSE